MCIQYRTITAIFIICVFEFVLHFYYGYYGHFLYNEGNEHNNNDTYAIQCNFCYLITSNTLNYDFHVYEMENMVCTFIYF